MFDPKKRYTREEIYRILQQMGREKEFFSCPAYASLPGLLAKWFCRGGKRKESIKGVQGQKTYYSGEVLAKVYG